MNKLKFQATTNENGQVKMLSIGGSLVVENSLQIKDELLTVLKQLNDSVDIEINAVDDIDLSFIQLMVSFTSELNEKGINYKLRWKLDEEHRVLFENVGFDNELFMNK
jgi:anti-anti-sigma regulatory factor